MAPDDDRDSRPAEPTLFEKRPDTPQKRPKTRVPAGVFVGVFIAVIVILAIVLFSAASCGGTGGNGRTTGGMVLLLPTLLG